MMVCAHGNVTDFCKEHGMVICDTWNGDLSKYNGICRVLVTDSDISENEYYFLKGELLAKGVELISTRHKDDKLLSEFLVYSNSRRKVKYRGRKAFGEKDVIQRILELRKAGATLREIREDERVRHLNGNKLSLSTISAIVERETRARAKENSKEDKR